jgi:DNA-directed RNA polymerase specialized sigma24 family protein
VQAGVDRLDPAAEGFEAFYVREYQAVVRLAYALSGSRLAAEDIAQDAFLRAFRDWDHIRQPSAWVRKVTVRRAGWTVHRRLLEATAVARVLAGRGPVVAELPEEDAEVWRAVRAPAEAPVAGDRPAVCGRCLGCRDRPDARDGRGDGQGPAPPGPPGPGRPPRRLRGGPP